MAVVVAGAGLALVLAGCGGSDDSPGATETVTVTASPTATSAPVDPSTPAVTTTPTPTPSPVDLSQAPTSYDEASAHVLAALSTSPRSVNRFETPSGNIYCALNVASMPAACEIDEGSVEDTSVCAVPQISSYVGRIELDEGRWVPICNTDTIRTPGAPVLPYGAAVETRDVQCVSERIGVTCLSRSARDAFFLRKGEYVLFDEG